MPQLFSISFQPGAIVTKYDDKGKMITQKTLQEPIVMHALPYQTTTGYAHLPGFKRWPYEMEKQRHSQGKGQVVDHGWGASGTKRVERKTASSSGSGKKLNTAAPVSAEDKRKRAASSGDLGAAINEAGQ